MESRRIRTKWEKHSGRSLVVGCVLQAGCKNRIACPFRIIKKWKRIAHTSKRSVGCHQGRLPPLVGALHDSSRTFPKGLSSRFLAPILRPSLRDWVTKDGHVTASHHWHTG